jgi:putative hydrolase of the HAD superfamily
MRQHLLIDADDTLWENNIYFERAFEAFCEFLDHSALTNEQVRDALDEIELANILVHGYGAENFGRNMLECYYKLVERTPSARDARTVMEFAERILDHPLDILAGVPETLEYLATRHDLILFTKGKYQEQQAKINASGFDSLFREVVIVKEKDKHTYRRVVEERHLPDHKSWMVGNSPKSDINPALEAGIGAVYVPHPRTWHLEKMEIQNGNRLLRLEQFSDLRIYF